MIDLGSWIYVIESYMFEFVFFWGRGRIVNPRKNAAKQTAVDHICDVSVHLFALLKFFNSRI